MKASEGNVRRGPSLDHRIDWVFKHANTPLMVTAEFNNWRRIEDSSGAGGWMHYSLLSGARTGLVTEPNTALRLKPHQAAATAAFAETGAILRLRTCENAWCDVRAGKARGWVHKSFIWGVRADENFD